MLEQNGGLSQHLTLQTTILLDHYNQLMNRLIASKNVLAELETDTKMTNSFVIIELLNLFLLEFIFKDAHDILALDTDYFVALLGGACVNSEACINIFYLQPNWLLISGQSVYTQRIDQFYKIIGLIEPSALKVFLANIICSYQNVIGDEHAKCEQIKLSHIIATTAPKQNPEAPPTEKKLTTKPKALKGILKKESSSSSSTKKTATSVTWNNAELNDQALAKCYRILRGKRHGSSP